MRGVVEILWLLLSLIVSTVSIIALMQPNWLVNPYTMETVGLLTHCYISKRPQIQRICTFHDNYYFFGTFPSPPWQMTAVMYTIATMLMAFSVIAGIFSTIHLNKRTREMVATAASYSQAVSVLMACACVLIYPIVFGDDRVRNICGRSKPYCVGYCQIGWSYMLAIAGCAIGIFCPYLAQHIDVFLEECDPPELFTQHQQESQQSQAFMTRARTMSSFKSTSTHSSFV